MTIRFTHGYDLLYRIATASCGFGIVYAVAIIISPISKLLEKTLNNNSYHLLWVILFLAFIFVGYVLAVNLLQKTILPDWLSTYLHIRLDLFVKVSPEEAKKLSFLFDGSLDGTWYRLERIRKIHTEFRKETLLSFANKIANQNGWNKPFLIHEDNNKQSNQPNKNNILPIDEQLLINLKILGVNEKPTNFEGIKLAYRRKIGEFHPDKFRGVSPEVLSHLEEMTKQINVAFTFVENYYNSSKI